MTGNGTPTNGVLVLRHLGARADFGGGMMRAALIVVALSLVSCAAFGWSACGVALDLPSGWTAEVTNSDKFECEVGLAPKHWNEMVRKSRWDDGEYAINLTVYRAGFEEAARDLDFERDEKGRWRDVSGNPVEKVRFGSFSGFRSEQLYRGFAKEGAELGEQSRVFSGASVILLLHDRKGTVVAIKFNRWNPDIKVDRDAAVSKIAGAMTVP